MRTTVDRKAILDAIRMHYNYTKKADFARFLGIPTTTLSTWYTRNTFDYDILYSKCEGISPEYLMNGTGDMFKSDTNGVSVMKEDIAPYITQRRQQKLEAKEIYFPVYNINTRLREDPRITVYEDDPEMMTPIAFLPQAAFPGCDHGERATGNSMYPRVVNQGMAIGKVIDKSKLVFNEMYGIHVKGGSPPIIKYVKKSDKAGCVRFVSERESLDDQDWPLDDITFIFRVLFIINPT